MQRLLILLVTAASLAAGHTASPPLSGGGCAVESTTREVFAFEAGGTVEVTDSIGNVIVEGWDRSDVEVTVTKKLRGADADQIDVTPLRAGDGRFLVATHLPEPLRGAIAPAGVTYRIKVPHDSHLLIRHDKGSVRVEGVRGNIDAMSYQGEMQVRLPNDQRYRVDAHSQAGDVVSEIEETRDGVERELHLRTNGGGITIKRESKPREVPSTGSMT